MINTRYINPKINIINPKINMVNHDYFHIHVIFVIMRHQTIVEHDLISY